MCSADGDARSGVVSYTDRTLRFRETAPARNVYARWPPDLFSQDGAEFLALDHLCPDQNALTDKSIPARQSRLVVVRLRRQLAFSN